LSDWSRRWRPAGRRAQHLLGPQQPRGVGRAVARAPVDHDPLDPAVFSDNVVRDSRVRALAQAIRVSGSEAIKGWGARLDVTLKDGRTFGGQIDTWLGCPETPLSPEQLRAKFDRITQGASKRLRETLFDELMRLDQVKTLEMLALT